MYQVYVCNQRLGNMLQVCSQVFFQKVFSVTVYLYSAFYNTTVSGIFNGLPILSISTFFYYCWILLECFFFILFSFFTVSKYLCLF